MPRKPEPSYSPRVVDYFPRTPHPELLLIGEAPGPLGANRTGYPFWGDHSGLDLYGLIEELGLLEQPLTRWKRGEDLSGSKPPAGKYAITNACPQMPLAADGGFCAPSPDRLERESHRIAEEIRTLHPRTILACGKAAAWTLARASIHLGAEPPAPLRGTLQQLKLTEAMNALLDHEWQIGDARAFVTCHPSRGQWLPQTVTGKLHAQLVQRLARSLG